MAIDQLVQLMEVLVAQERLAMSRIEELVGGQITGHLWDGLVFSLEDGQRPGEELQRLVLDQLERIRLIVDQLAHWVQWHAALVEVAAKCVARREASEKVCVRVGVAFRGPVSSCADSMHFEEVPLGSYSPEPGHELLACLKGGLGAPGGSILGATSNS